MRDRGEMSIPCDCCDSTEPKFAAVDLEEVYPLCSECRDVWLQIDPGDRARIVPLADAGEVWRTLRKLQAIYPRQTPLGNN